jgi:uncharacterized membrane protein
MRIALLVLGILLVLLGLLWIGQGTGYFPYPSYSFMIDQSAWAWRGLGVAVVGLAVLLWSRRMRR